jgi:hypothetical protein
VVVGVVDRVERETHLQPTARERRQVEYLPCEGRAVGKLAHEHDLLRDEAVA